jgi:cell division control protein 45
MKLKAYIIMYLLPPSYPQAYAKILATFRSSPLTSASSVLILVAPDADALCAARMLSDLFNQDDVIHRIRPISGFDELERIRDDLLNYTEVVQIYLYLLVLADHSYVAPHPHSS